MTTRLTPCPSCSRHVRGETACPFCGTSRSMVAAGAALALSGLLACGQDLPPPPPPQPTPVVAPVAPTLPPMQPVPTAPVAPLPIAPLPVVPEPIEPDPVPPTEPEASPEPAPNDRRRTRRDTPGELRGPGGGGAVSAYGTPFPGGPEGLDEP